MAKLKEIFVSSGGDRDQNAYAYAATAVYALYSEAIRPAGLPARHWSMMLGAGPGDIALSEVRVRVHEGSADGELGKVGIPRGIADLDPAVVALLALDVVHAAMSQLGRVRGWDQRVLDAARQYALDRGLVWRTATPWKASPSRRHRARSVRQIGHLGHSQMWIEVESTASGELVELSSELFVERGKVPLEPRLLRWRSADVVHLGSPSSLYPDRTITVTVAGSAAGPVHSPFRDPLQALPRSRPRPSVVLLPQRLTEICPNITYAQGVPLDHRERLQVLFDAVQGPAWTSWWERTGRDQLAIQWSFGSTRPGFMMTRKGEFGFLLSLSKNELYVSVWRRAASVEQSADPASLADDDFRSVMTAICRRMKLPAQPPLPRSPR